MGEQNYNIEQDLYEAEAMAAALEPYIYEDKIYHNLGGRGLFKRALPNMTLGAFILRLRRLRALELKLSGEQSQRLRAIEARHEAVREEWRVHYEKKLIAEAISRLNAMRTFFEECAEKPQQCRNIYMPEAFRRTVVQELVAVAEDMDIESAELRQKLGYTDIQLQGLLHPDDFIWAEILEDVYPREVFWWLYARPKA